MKHTGGAWDVDEGNVYFVASSTPALRHAVGIHDYMLVAVNEININNDHVKLLEEWCDKGVRLLIDSGVYNFSLEYSKSHNISFYEALAMDPENMDGFSALFDKYCKVMDVLGDKAWGYIEVDQGGVTGKRHWRSELETLGYCPIPVYHPLTDGWEYFDELASQYDRICVGNVVNSSREVRRRICASMWERKQKYPNLWIHLLGMTASEMSCAYPISSCDSSTWLRAIRWPAPEHSHVSLSPYSQLPYDFKYRLGAANETEYGPRKATELAAYTSKFLMMNWREMVKAYKQCGLTL